jgi:hypothetical protein
VSFLTIPLTLSGGSHRFFQLAAMVPIGRHIFKYPLLQAALDRLAEADILLVQYLPPESDYRFKHALIQDAAYENLLKSRRQVLHRRVGEALRDNLAASAAAEPEFLAHHFRRPIEVQR